MAAGCIMWAWVAPTSAVARAAADEIVESGFVQAALQRADQADGRLAVSFLEALADLRVKLPDVIPSGAGQVPLPLAVAVWAVSAVSEPRRAIAAVAGSFGEGGARAGLAMLAKCRAEQAFPTPALEAALLAACLPR